MPGGRLRIRTFVRGNTERASVSTGGDRPIYILKGDLADLAACAAAPGSSGIWRRSEGSCTIHRRGGGELTLTQKQWDLEVPRLLSLSSDGGTAASRCASEFMKTADAGQGAHGSGTAACIIKTMEDNRTRTVHGMTVKCGKAGAVSLTFPGERSVRIERR